MLALSFVHHFTLLHWCFIHMSVLCVHFDIKSCCYCCCCCLVVVFFFLFYYYYYSECEQRFGKITFSLCVLYNNIFFIRMLLSFFSLFSVSLTHTQYKYHDTIHVACCAVIYATSVKTQHTLLQATYSHNLYICST